MSNVAEFTIVGADTLHCGGCENRVKTALKRVDGVEDVDASFTTQRVSVRFDATRTSVDVLRARIETLGYALKA